MSRNRVCSACGTDAPSVRPSRLWTVAVIAVWLSMPAMVGAAALTGVMIVAFGPLVFMVGAGLLGPLHEKAFQPPRCAHCGRVRVEEPTHHTPGAREALAEPESSPR